MSAFAIFPNSRLHAEMIELEGGGVDLTLVDLDSGRMGRFGAVDWLTLHDREGALSIVFERGGVIIEEPGIEIASWDMLNLDGQLYTSNMDA